MQKMQSFLLDQIKTSVEALENSNVIEGEEVSSKHTSLYAILVLLSNMVPSRLETPKEIQTGALFIPLIQRYVF